MKIRVGAIPGQPQRNSDGSVFGVRSWTIFRAPAGLKMNTVKIARYQTLGLIMFYSAVGLKYYKTQRFFTFFPFFLETLRLFAAAAPPKINGFAAQSLTA